jgi:AcrR family transcriptional regulator
MQNADTDPQNIDSNDVAARIARQTLANRGPDYSSEVRRLLDAGREVMRQCGTRSRPRVADIVAAAGVSNDAFYRHFASKDALVAAILDDGAERLRSYLAHMMSKESTPQGEVRRWVEGILAQAADEEIAATTLAVLWNAGNLGQALASRPPAASAPLATLLHVPFAELGSADPELDASLIAYAVVGQLTEHLWHGARPTRAEIDHLVAFCMATATAPPATRRSGRR